MVLVVLAQPETVGEPGKKICQNQSGPVVELVVSKDLTVRSFVSDEAILSAHYA